MQGSVHCCCLLLPPLPLLLPMPRLPWVVLLLPQLLLRLPQAMPAVASADLSSGAHRGQG